MSVIVPIHNAREYLARTNENLRRIAQGDVEFIVIDDHSDDGSGEMVKDWDDLANLLVLSSTTRGVAATRNQAVAAATGDFLWFADCDDDWDAEVVSSMLREADRAGADIVVSNAVKVMIPGDRSEIIQDASVQEQITGSEALQRLLVGSIQGHLWNKLFARHLFESAPFPATRAHSDLGGMFALLAAAKTVALLPEAHYTYYVHDGSILNQRAYRWLDLWDCLELAEAAVDAEGDGSDSVRQALIVFTYRNVIVPSINETIRREVSASPDDIRTFRARGRKRVKSRDLVWLASHGQADAAVRGGVIKWAFPAYRALYRRHRARTWAAVDQQQAQSAQK
ncbi:glycosyltransferase family 2 protein [Herbiconiux liangxiaofengii]|uniref:glycosyltransferase family 2 protein n=1 Tax=Herbiconiux liangxiaofengii TaxID=3342795 RepID=UPI0035BB47D8